MQPRVIPVPGGAVVEQIDEYAIAVAGGPPPQFESLMDDAKRLIHPWAQRVILGLPDEPDPPLTDDQKERALDRLRDTFLCAAYAYSHMRNRGKGEIGLSFVQRAKQVADWCRRPMRELSELVLLENKTRELARMVAARLFPGEGFTLLIFQEGPHGQLTWISSAENKTTIDVLADAVKQLRAAEATRS